MTHRNVEAYGKEKKKYSLKLAQLYKKRLKDNFNNKQDYNRYRQLIEESGIPWKMLDKIETTILLGNGNYRPIDIYQFW